MHAPRLSVLPPRVPLSATSHGVRSTRICSSRPEVRARQRSLAAAPRWKRRAARGAGAAPASTTACASSGECLAMSASAEAATRRSGASGSCAASTSSGTAPAPTTCAPRTRQGLQTRLRVAKQVALGCCPLPCRVLHNPRRCVARPLYQRGQAAGNGAGQYRRKSWCNRRERLRHARGVLGRPARAPAARAPACGRRRSRASRRPPP
jgi:hypothetical protein